MEVWESLTWLEKGAVLGLFMIAAYAAWSISSLLWRVPELILAKKELAAARTRYYDAKTEEIVKENNPVAHLK